jgi:hypothetical protein
MLARELAAFGYYTLLYVKNPTISVEQFCALVRKFHLPNIKDFNSFSDEFDYLLTNLDIRYFLYKEDSQMHKAVESIRGEQDSFNLKSLGFSEKDLANDIDLKMNTFGFDLFRRVSTERNW